MAMALSGGVAPLKASPHPPQEGGEIRRLAEEMARRRQALHPHPRFAPVDNQPFFDLPVTYNQHVRTWINHFQGPGRRWFERWLSRSHRYMPSMKRTLVEAGLPQDLIYVAMIESGFSPRAVSTASAVGYWQFIAPTANRYGLKTDWWLDERRDYRKSTRAAARYLSDLYRMFDSWYLAAAAYNMGEGRLRRLIERHKTRDFWILAQKRDFPRETRDYIPKILAAMIIAKAPHLYGFDNITPMAPMSYEYFYVPGGTDLVLLAEHLGVQENTLKRINPELVKGFVPTFVNSHRIRIPQGQSPRVSQYIRAQL